MSRGCSERPSDAHSGLGATDVSTYTGDLVPPLSSLSSSVESSSGGGTCRTCDVTRYTIVVKHNRDT